MLILPILNKDKIFNAKLSLKSVTLENNATLLFEKVGESDVMVNSKTGNTLNSHSAPPIISLIP